MKENKKRLAIVDPVGIKAGMDLYDINLCEALIKLKTESIIVSNFNYSDTFVYSVFKKKSEGLLNKITNIIKGHFRAFILVRRKKIKTVLLHSFSFEFKDFIPLVMARFFRFNIILIVHDVSGFAKKDNKFLRYLILNNFSDKIIVHNEFSREALFKYATKKIKNKAVVVKHGSYIDNTFKKYSKKQALLKFGLDNRVKYILFFGQIKKVKGLDILIKAFSKIKSNNVKLVIAGKPWEDSFGDYEKIINELDVQSKIIPFIEYISLEKRDLLFSLADFVVLPYREIYQSGVLLMVMSNNIPVIASDLKPFKELIQKANGLLFEANNENDLAKKIEFALENKNIMEEKAKKALALMNSEYNWNKIALEYNKIIIN